MRSKFNSEKYLFRVGSHTFEIRLTKQKLRLEIVVEKNTKLDITPVVWWEKYQHGPVAIVAFCAVVIGFLTILGYEELVRLRFLLSIFTFLTAVTTIIRVVSMSGSVEGRGTGRGDLSKSD